MGKPGKAPRAKKPSYGQKELRLREVYKLLMSHKSRPEILAHCSKEWGLKRASGDALIQAANRMIREDLDASKEQVLLELMQTQKDLYEKIVNDRPTSSSDKGESIGLPNYGAARQLLMDRAKLMGLAKDRVIVTDEDDEEFDEMSDEELDAELEGE